MSNFYTVFHLDWGSSVEAADPVEVAGPHASHVLADEYGKDVCRLATGVNPDVLGPPTLDEFVNGFFWTVVEVPESLVPADATAKKIKDQYGSDN